MDGALRELLHNATAVFAPSCIGLSVLTKRDWIIIKIDDVSLADAYVAGSSRTCGSDSSSGANRIQSEPAEAVPEAQQPRLAEAEW